MTWPPPSCPCQGTQYAISSVWRGGPRGARTTWSAMKHLPVTSPHAPLGCCLESISCSWPLPVEWLSLGASSCLLSWSGPAFRLPQSCAFHLLLMALTSGVAVPRGLFMPSIVVRPCLSFAPNLCLLLSPNLCLLSAPQLCLSFALHLCLSFAQTCAFCADQSFAFCFWLIRWS